MITSNTNYLIKMVSSLHYKKGRQEHNLYIAEGIHLVQEALSAGAQIKYFFWSAKLNNSLEGVELLNNLQPKYDGYEISEPLFLKICETQNPQGILAVLQIPDQPVFDLIGFTLGFIIDGLQDPGNVGTIIRTAWACNLDGLFFTPGTADPYQGKVVRASQGGLFYQSIYRDLEPQHLVAQAKEGRIQIVAGDAKASEVYFEADLTLPTLIIIGNEGKGLTDAWQNYRIKKVFIPQPGRAESLNAAVSAGILVYEAIRQCSLKNSCKS